MSDNGQHLQQQQQQQQAWQNYYAYQQQYYAQQPPVYPFAPPTYQQWNPITSLGSLPPPPPTQPISLAYSTQATYPPKRPRTEVADHSYHCDVCELSLESQIALAAHLKSHIVCSDCTFTASPKLVKAHHAAVHGKFRGNGFKTITVAIPGCKVQRYRICVGNHPEDVKKWIADRRKKFPRQQRPEPVAAKDESQFSGLLDGYGSSSEDEAVKPVNLESKAAVTLKTAESQQVPSQASNGDQTNIATKTSSASTAAANTDNAPNYRSQTCRYFARTGTCRNGDNCTFRHEGANHSTRNTSLNSTPVQQRDPKRQKMGNMKKTGTTLLQKLLQSDANREAALTLQLLQYIVDCNFLQKTQPANDNAE